MTGWVEHFIISGMDWQRLNGHFIVLDGPDGSGKSTQLELLYDFIIKQGVSAVKLRDPGGTKIGDQIRGILLDRENAEMSVRCELLLYMASRAQLYGELIGPTLAGGGCVLCDRWISSTYAYQAVAGKVGREALLHVAEVALERTWPDLTIIIDLPSEVGLERVGRSPDRMECKDGRFHQRVREAFLELAMGREDFRVVEGTGTVEQVQGRIREVLKAYVHS